MKFSGELVNFPVTPYLFPFNRKTADELEHLFGDRRTDGPRPPTPAPHGLETDADDDRVVLCLYVSPDSMSCARAVVALQQMIRQFPPRAFRVQIVDVAADVDAAARESVLFTPTLMMMDKSGRATRVLGDLSNASVLVELLRGTGLEPV